MVRNPCPEPNQTLISLLSKWIVTDCVCELPIEKKNGIVSHSSNKTSIDDRIEMIYSAKR